MESSICIFVVCIELRRTRTKLITMTAFYYFILFHLARLKLNVFDGNRCNSNFKLYYV